MPQTRLRVPSTVLVILGIVTPAGCGGSKAYVRAGFLEHPPRRVAVLPFTITYQYDLADQQPPEAHRIGRDLFRKTFYYAFAPYGYEDIELPDVDEQLTLAYGPIEQGGWRNATPQALGQTLGADAVIYGDLNLVVHVSMPLYTDTRLRGSLRMADAVSGEMLWRKAFHAGERGGALVKGGQAVDFVADQIQSRNPAVKFMLVSEAAARQALADIPNPPMITASAEGRPETSKKSLRILVLPFERKQEKWRREAAFLRRQVSAGLQEGPYEIMELQRVDAALKDRGWTEEEPPPRDPAVLSQLASSLGADAYLRGTVVGWGRRFLVVESWVQAELQLQLVDAASGETLWSEQKRHARHAGLLKGPTGFVSAATAPVLGLRTFHLERVASQLARMMAEDLNGSPGVKAYAETPPGTIATPSAGAETGGHGGVPR